MQLNRFIEYYHQRHLPEESLQLATSYLKQFEEFCQSIGLSSIDQATTDLIDRFIEQIRTTNVNELELLLALGRYYRLIKQHVLYIHITLYLGKLGVLESILKRLSTFINDTLLQDIMSELCDIDLLATPSETPTLLKHWLDALEEQVEPHILQDVLAYNHHQIPKSAFDDEVKYYQEASSLDQYLIDLHKRKIEEITTCYNNNTIWYEQTITQGVIDYVKSNQEILSAVRIGEDLYVTKIPYDTEAYLASENKTDQSFHACHCPFAKAAIKKEQVIISPNWCYCSGGFTKYPFEIIFNQELKVTPLELALKGDARCRFKISLEGINYK